MILGKFDHDVEWPKDEEGNYINNNSNNNRKKDSPQQQQVPYHKQMYTNGSLCDLTGEMRLTEVRVSYFKTCKKLSRFAFFQSWALPNAALFTGFYLGATSALEKIRSWELPQPVRLIH